MEKIDVFIRSAPPSTFRQKLQALTVEAWGFDPMANIVPIIGSVTEKDFHWKSRMTAERLAQGPWYVLSDDDILPLGADWIERAMNIIPHWPDFSILGANQVNHSARVKNPGFDVEPMSSVGSPQLIRKGTIDWSKLHGPGIDEDKIIGEYCAAHNIKIGCMVEMDVNHAGQGFSTMNPAYWGKY
jgi:hypothetical protein